MEISLQCNAMMAKRKKKERIYYIGWIGKGSFSFLCPDKCEDGPSVQMLERDFRSSHGRACAPMCAQKKTEHTNGYNS